MDQNTMLGLMALRDGFGSLRSMGGGPQGPQNALPMAMQYRQQQQEQEKLQQALAQAKQGGLPMGMNPKAFEALSSVDPRQALGMLTQGAKPAAKPSSVQEYEYGQQNPGYADWIQSQKGEKARRIIKGADGRNYYADTQEPVLPGVTPRDRNGITIDKDGNVQIGGEPRKLTEQQGKYTLFGNMMKATMPVINGLEEKFDPSNVADNLAANAGAVGEFFKSNEYQRYETAGRAWAEGVLRLQTGAAATQPEIERVFETYFARPGNDAETIEYKRKLRSEYASAIEQASGGLVDPNQGLQSPPAPAGPRKNIGGVTYEQRNGKWGTVQ